ncbi:uncharacterized protein BDR25DRAFT_317653 [Lindgomyces ingoldianus]|uniref:Uncharacterized protein n=1 Tax=Lindgomyces ingoldianus TaxID=673940 RepID=A0ACB6QH70_9PLEO|nr:uncharacterized protein BDR25DRAFT_317653 [Lindgomyces ingoldianus]KAF2466232.1 hypothetical protein BDR25DRAFT_317653 [Lindgomyces ingoldianus]
MNLLWIRSVLFLITTAVAVASGPTRIFINTIPEYSLLATCAELEVSTIVRDMAYGCGDGSKTTSWACFCYESSAKFSSMIGKHVSTACTSDPSQNTTALEVFSSYCQLGQVAAQTSGMPTSTTPSSAAQSAIASTPTASPASGPVTVYITATSSPLPSASSRSDSHVAAIAVGISVPTAVIALIIAAFMIFRSRKRKQSGLIELATASESIHEATWPGPNVYEMKHDEPKLKPPPVEIGDQEHVELDTRRKDEFRAVHELEGTQTSR